MGEFTTYIPEEYWDQIATALNSTLEPPTNREFIHRYEYGADHKIKDKKILVGEFKTKASKNKVSPATSNEGAQ